MYRVILDGQILYYPGDDLAVVLSPQLSLSTGYAGEFTCDVPTTNPLYDKIENRSSMVAVYRDKKELFYGEVKTCQKNQWKDKNIYCTGALSFLSDSIQPQVEYHDMSPRQMLETFLNIHNDQVEERKQIKIGIVTIHDTNDSLYRYTNFENTLEAIRDKLVDRLGGYLRLRHEPDGLYLDWITLAEYGKYCEQAIDFGENLLDYSESLDSMNLITALIPLGARIEQEEGAEPDPEAIGALEKYTDITSVNGGKNYIYSEEAVAAFGWVCGINHWDDVTVPANLLRKGREYLADNQFEQLTLELTALDLSLMDTSYDSFDCGDRIRCRAKPYGMDRAFPVMDLSIPLAEPEKATLKLGETKSRGGLTGEVSSSVARVEREAKEREYEMTDWFGSAIDNATQMLTGQKGGYKLSEFDKDGRWLRDLYMDAPTKEEATFVMQISMNGIGFSRTGYEGPYLNAWTIDGTFLGEFIKAHSIEAEALSTEYTEHVETLIEDAETGAKEYVDDKVTASVKSLEGQITLAVDTERTRASGVEETLSSRIQVNQNGISAEVTRAKGAEESLGSRITQTESSITSEVSRAQKEEGDLSSRITQTSDSISSEVTRAKNAESDLGSRITQTETAISSKVSRSDVSSMIDQFADNISLKVTNGKLGSSASITLSVDGTTTSGSLDLTGVRTAFKNDTTAITISSGTVTFNSNTFVVNSTNFKVTSTGVMTATGANFNDGVISIKNEDTNTEIYMARNGLGIRKLSGTTGWAVQLVTSTTGNQGSITARGLVNNYYAALDGGSGGYVSTTGTVQASKYVTTSDKRFKKDITELDDRYDKFFDALEPVNFKWIQLEDERGHLGFIAQEIQATMKEVGISEDEFGVISNLRTFNVEESETKSVSVGRESDKLSLNYQEFIPMIIWELQKVKKQLKTLAEV